MSRVETGLPDLSSSLLRVATTPTGIFLGRRSSTFSIYRPRSCDVERASVRVPLYPRHVALLWISINDNVRRFAPVTYLER